MKQKTQFTLFQSHIDLAHSYWKKILNSESIIIDATCGNGHDTLMLASHALCNESTGLLYALDVQQSAIESTKQLLAKEYGEDVLKKITLLHQCHSSFPLQIAKESVSLIVYNLGYLPGGDKSLTTLRHTTLQSLENGLHLIKQGGAISITCYPGHPEGKIEEDLILDFARKLSPKQWSSCHHRWLNRESSPSLLIIQRAIS